MANVEFTGTFDGMDNMILISSENIIAFSERSSALWTHPLAGQEVTDHHGNHATALYQHQTEDFLSPFEWWEPSLFLDTWLQRARTWPSSTTFRASRSLCNEQQQPNLKIWTWRPDLRYDEMQICFTSV